MIAWCPAFGWLHQAWNTTGYYNYYFDMFSHVGDFREQDVRYI